ncbi:MAG: RNA-binding protein [Acidobacteria bacterium]|nr:RNA-binding protein [Acidobacteriota bacterium]
MAFRLYVGGLSLSTEEDEVRELFSQIGDVASCRLVRDRDSNKSRGFAFLEMASEADAQRAISQFNGYQLSGQTLTVNVAREKRETDGRSGRGSSDGRRY